MLSIFMWVFGGVYTVILFSFQNIPKSKSLRHHWKLTQQSTLRLCILSNVFFSGRFFFRICSNCPVLVLRKESLMVLNQLLHRVQECSRTFSGFPAVKFPKCMMWFRESSETRAENSGVIGVCLCWLFSVDTFWAKTTVYYSSYYYYIIKKLTVMMQGPTKNHIHPASSTKRKDTWKQKSLHCLSLFFCFPVLCWLSGVSRIPYRWNR